MAGVKSDFVGLESQMSKQAVACVPSGIEVNPSSIVLAGSGSGSGSGSSSK